MRAIHNPQTKSSTKPKLDFDKREDWRKMVKYSMNQKELCLARMLTKFSQSSATAYSQKTSSSSSFMASLLQHNLSKTARRPLFPLFLVLSSKKLKNISALTARQSKEVQWATLGCLWEQWMNWHRYPYMQQPSVLNFWHFLVLYLEGRVSLLRTSQSPWAKLHWIKEEILGFRRDIQLGLTSTCRPGSHRFYFGLEFGQGVNVRAALPAAGLGGLHGTAGRTHRVALLRGINVVENIRSHHSVELSLILLRTIACNNDSQSGKNGSHLFLTARTTCVFPFSDPSSQNSKGGGSYQLERSAI